MFPDILSIIYISSFPSLSVSLSLPFPLNPPHWVCMCVCVDERERESLHTISYNNYLFALFSIYFLLQFISVLIFSICIYLFPWDGFGFSGLSRLNSHSTFIASYLMQNWFAFILEEQFRHCSMYH